MSDHERVALRTEAAALGVMLDARTEDRLLHFIALLAKWNAVYNLTSVRNTSQMRSQHVVDCLAVVEPLRRHFITSKSAQPTVLDAGSGGGLPGVVLAALNLGWRVTCVDAVGKKAAFVQQVAVELALPDLRAVHARLEAFGGDRETFDVVTSRAFASLDHFTRLTRRLVAPDGVWMAMKGQEPAAEIAALPNTIDMFRVEPLTVPGLGARRCLVWMRPR